MALDPRFLTVHPRTALWWRQRSKCEKCAHRVEGPEHRDGKGGVLCSVVFRHIGAERWVGRSINAYCIDAREPDAKCGPAAKLFKPR